MAITGHKYHKFLLGQLTGVANGVIDFDTDTIKLALVTASYTPDAANHDFFDDVSANEVSGTNYSAGGITLANVSVAVDGSGVVTFDNTIDLTISQSASGFSNARYGIIYKSTGTGSTSRLIAYIDFGANIGNSVADLVIQFNASGIITWS